MHVTQSTSGASGRAAGTTTLATPKGRALEGAARTTVALRTTSCSKSGAHEASEPRTATPTTMTFDDLDLVTPILQALKARGYETPTPIQAQAIPHLLKGRDLLGVAQTGTGKTAAFALPILDILSEPYRKARSRCPAVLVMTPTRELAAQIAESFEAYGAKLPVTSTVIFGGVGQRPQVERLRRGVDVLVATPGRLLDLMGQGHVDLRDVELFVLDEADRMLDMGFLRDVRRVLEALPDDRQSLLFSATMPPDIVALAQKLLDDPVRVEVTPPSTTVERIDQKVIFVEKFDKRPMLLQILEDQDIERTLVFSRTKYGADKIARYLDGRGVSAAALHGNKSQGQRERALAAFRAGAVRALVATDIAARGLDVPGVTHVINFDLPNMPESYVHRIGRTARAGRDGVAISFCATDEREYLRDIEKETRQRIEVLKVTLRAPSRPRTAGPGRPGGRGTQGGGRRGGRRGGGGSASAGAGQGGRSRRRRGGGRSGRRR